MTTIKPEPGPSEAEIKARDAVMRFSPSVLGPAECPYNHEHGPWCDDAEAMAAEVRRLRSEVSEIEARLYETLARQWRERLAICTPPDFIVEDDARKRELSMIRADIAFFDAKAAAARGGKP